MNKLLFLDYETYYDAKYSLTKQSTSEYIRDPRWLEYGASAAWGVDGTPAFYRKKELADFLISLDWSQITLVAHHTHLEGFILHTHHAIHPARYSCTMSMARAIYQGAVGVGLHELAQHEKIGGKLDVLKETKGVLEPSPELWDKIAALCNNDVATTQKFYELYAHQIPQSEHDIIHTNIRLFANPRAHVDVELAKEGLAEALEHKASLVAATGLTKDDISKDGRFVEHLKAAGATIPMKFSAKQKKDIPAFASTDEGFQKLLIDPNDTIRNLAIARQAVSSTIDEAKAKRLITRGTTGDKLLPLYIAYYAANTGRDGGGDDLNPQNFRRKSKLRRAIKAPPDHVLNVGDAAQIECRVCGDLADEHELLDQFRRKEDVYALLATDIFGFTVNRKVHIDEGFIGKTARLGLQFHMGAERFQATVAKDSTKFLGKTIILPIEKCKHVVSTYRRINRATVALWGKADDWLRFMVFGKGQITYKYLTIDADAKRIWLPNGMWLSYPGLRCINAEYSFWNGRFWEYIFSGKLIENVVQALARIITFGQLQRIDLKYPLIMKTHDEGVWISPAAQADEALAFGLNELRTPPTWSPDIPLDAEGGYDTCYSK